MQKISKLLLVTILLSSCTSGKKQYSYTPIEIGDAIFVTPEILRTEKLHANIYDLRILDSVLIMRSDDGNGCFQLFNKKDFRFIRTNGVYGRGPGEFHNDMVEIKIIDDSVQIFQLQKNRLNIYSKNTFLNDSLPIAERVVNFDTYRGNFETFPLKGYYLSRPTIKTRFALYNCYGQFINDYKKFPKFERNLNEETCDYAVRQFCFTEPKPDLSKFVSLTYVGGILVSCHI